MSDQNTPPDPNNRIDSDGDDGELPTAPPPSAYSYKAAHERLSAEILDQAMSSHRRESDLGTAVSAAAAAAGLGPNDPLVQTLHSLAWYRLKVDRTGEKAGAQLEPLKDEGDGRPWPQPIRSVSEEVKKLWSGVSAFATHPAASARVHDLCFSGQVGNGRTHALAAFRAYLLWPTTELDAQYVTMGLVRAWTLARLVRDAELETDAYKAIGSYAQAQLDQGGNPGTVLPLLEVLAAPSPNRATAVSTDTANRLIDRARSVFTASYLQVRLTTLMRRLATDDSSREVANRAEVQAHLDEADGATNGGARMHHLEVAAQTARRFHLKDMEAIAVRRLQGLSPDDLGMQRIKSTSTMPAYIPESFLRQFDEAHDWREALHRFLHTESPTDSYERNLKAAKASVKRPSLRHLFPTKRIGSHGLPQQTLGTDDDRIQEDLVLFEEISMGIYGLWFADGLDRIATTYGVPTKDEIAAYLVGTYGCDTQVARSFATALRLFWQEEYDACVHLALPRIEGAARVLLLELDEPIYRVEEGRTIGQFPGLSFLLAQLLKNDFDPDWERFLGTMLLPRGENLRNLVAHGFVYDIARYRAALVLRAVGLMVLLSPTELTSRDAETIRTHMRDPLILAANYQEAHPIRSLRQRIASRLLNRTRRQTGHIRDSSR